MTPPKPTAIERWPDSPSLQLKLSELQSDYDHAWQDRQSAQERMDAAQEQAQALGVDLA